MSEASFVVFTTTIIRLALIIISGGVSRIVARPRRGQPTVGFSIVARTFLHLYIV